MTIESPDPFDTDLQSLFAGAHPADGFEDRLIAAVRQRQRLRLGIPTPVRKAAVAAAAVLMVGATGYYGNLAISGHAAARYRVAQNDTNGGPNLILKGINASVNHLKGSNDQWDFGGGSNSAQNWSIFSGSNGTSAANGWMLKNADATYAIASDINRGKVVAHGNPSPYDSQDSVLLPIAGDGEAPPTPPKGTTDAKTNDAGLYFKTAFNDGLGSVEGEKSKLAGPPQYGFLRTGEMDGDKKTSALADQLSRLQTEVGGADAQHDAAAVQFKIDKNTSALTANETNRKTIAEALQADRATPRSLAVAQSNQKEAQSSLLSALSKLDAANDSIQNASHDGFSQDLPKTSTMRDEEVKSDKSDRAGKVIEAETVFDPAAFLAMNTPDAIRTGQPATNPTTAPVVIDDRKIIRTGTMEFEVDRFDAAQMQITKIVLELGGFVGATDSQKLPNGKVRGSISVRVPPERLDVLVLSLRALGDLKSQQITAADVTKEYNDIESELKADRAMQDRLLDLIKSGKGAVKDLLAAENELGNWRTKIEKAEGMIRYYNSQIGLSTLSITLSERDIQTPSTAVETETADMGIEAEDVEKARGVALKSIDDVKGRVVEAELKRFDAGQLAARLVADVPPESAAAVIDQLKLIGKVARLEINRQQTNSDGEKNVTNTTPLKTERKPTRLLISIYNLANVAPRRTTNVSLAASDVEAAYTALATAAKTSGGRIVTSNLDRGDPVKATGSLVLEFPPDKFESAMTALHAQGDVLKLTLVENPDTQNSTEAKQGLTVQLVSLAAVPPRENIQQTLAATDVPSAYQSILAAANGEHARVLSAQLNEQDRQNITADLQLEIPRSAEMDFDKAVAAAGGTIARTSNRTAEADGTVDSKLAVHLSITSADHLAPRETTKLQVEVPDVDKSAANAQTAAISVGGRVLESTVTKDHGKGLARIILDVPLAKAGEVLQQVRAEGSVRGIDASRDVNAPSGPLAHAQIFVEFGTTEAIVADQTGPWASVRQGLSTSITGLLWSLQWVIVGLCLIVPWAVLGWAVWKVKNRLRGKASV